MNNTDPTGLDGVGIVFPDYQIRVGDDTYGDLGHAGVLLINPENGRTRYYEFGRYAPTDGVVRNISVPDVVMKDGQVTSASMEKALNVISDRAGHGGRIEAVNFKDADFSKMESYASGLVGQTGKEGYGDWSIYNSCATFMKNTLEKGGIDMPIIADPRPTSYIGEMRGEDRTTEMTLEQRRLTIDKENP